MAKKKSNRDLASRLSNLTLEERVRVLIRIALIHSGKTTYRKKKIRKKGKRKP